MKRLYWRCNGGHYFGSLHCPFDGWTSDDLIALNSAAENLRSQGVAPSIAALSAEGVGEVALRRAIVVEFGSERSVFDAISPDFYVISGRSVPLHKTGIDFN